MGKEKDWQRATLPRPNAVVPSPQRGLTTVFGMGTGVSPSLWLPARVSGSQSDPGGGIPREGPELEHREEKLAAISGDCSTGDGELKRMSKRVWLSALDSGKYADA